MNEGAFVLLDCLGFRGIWNKVDPQKLVDKLQNIDTQAQDHVAKKFLAPLSFGPIRTHLRLLSDTVALSIQYETTAYENSATPNQQQQNALVSLACQTASTLSKLFIDNEIPLPLRGCISFGRHLCEGNFLVGPAVDRAAEYMNEPNGAFVWLLPDVLERYKTFQTSASQFLRAPREEILAVLHKAAARNHKAAAKFISRPESTSETYIDSFRKVGPELLNAPFVVHPYPMPLKRGSTIDAGLINPFMSAHSAEDSDRIFARYLQALQGDHIDVWVKCQNTVKFLKSAKSAEMTFRASFNPRPQPSGDGGAAKGDGA